MNRPIAPAGAPTASAGHAVDVAVVGAGIIGLSIAWAVAQSGRTVAVIDRDPGGGATFAAAGMLAPVSELHYGEGALLELMLASAALYPAFIDSLGVSHAAAGYRTTRTLVVGADAADGQALRDLHAVQLANGLAVEALAVREARALEPALSPQLSSAFNIENDHQVDPRMLAARLQAALAAIARSHGWVHDPVVLQNVVSLLRAPSPGDQAPDAATTVTGVQLEDGSALRAGTVVVANGLAAAQLGGLPPALQRSLHRGLRAVHGDILRLRVPAHLRPLFTATIRGLVRGVPVYLVPRSDGTVVLGATQREDGLAGVSAGGIHQLLRDAQVLVPAVAELELLEVTARARPGTPDNAPLLGGVSTHAGDAAADVAGLIVATGFFRHGVLLAPLAARICVGLLAGEALVEERWRHFRPDRFAAAAAASVSSQGATS